MALTRSQQPHVRLRKPLIHNSRSRFHGEAVATQLRIRDHPQERRNRLPRQPERLAFRKNVFDPGAREQVEGGTAIVGVKQYVGVEDDYRWAASSMLSSKSPTLS